MAGKADFTEEEWETLQKGVTGAGLLGQSGQGVHAGTCSRTRPATSARPPEALTRTTRSGYRAAASENPRATAS